MREASCRSRSKEEREETQEDMGVMRWQAGSHRIASLPPNHYCRGQMGRMGHGTMTHSTQYYNSTGGGGDCGSGGAHCTVCTVYGVRVCSICT